MSGLLKIFEMHKIPFWKQNWQCFSFERGQQCPGGQFSWSVGSQEPPHLSPDAGEENHHHYHLKHPQLIHSRRLKLCEIKASRGSFKPWKGFRQKTSNMMRGKSLCGS